MKKEAHLSGGRMPTLNKEMGLQDAHTLLSVNDKHSPQNQPQTAWAFMQKARRAHLK